MTMGLHPFSCWFALLVLVSCPCLNVGWALRTVLVCWVEMMHSRPFRIRGTKRPRLFTTGELNSRWPGVKTMVECLPRRPAMFPLSWSGCPSGNMWPSRLMAGGLALVSLSAVFHSFIILTSRRDGLCVEFWREVQHTLACRAMDGGYTGFK